MEENKTATGTEQAAGRAGCFFCRTAKPTLKHLWSDATRNHFRSSRIEFLKGIRSILDDRISRLSGTEKTGTHVVVE